MNLAEAIALVSILLAIAGLIFKAGRSEANHRETEAQLKKDVQGIGQKLRDDMIERAAQYDRMAGCLILEVAARLMTGKDHSELERVVRRLLMD